MEIGASEMSNLEPEKRKRLVALVCGTLVLLVAMYLGVIRWQETVLLKRAQTMVELEQQIELAKRGSLQMEEYRRVLEADLKLLGGIEDRMAQGDLYRWIIKTMNAYTERHPRVDVSHFSPPEAGEAVQVPKLPYETAVFSVSGTAHYHDFGAFLRDLENDFPHFTLRRLSLDSLGARADRLDQRERLNFQLEFSMLVKPNVLTNEVQTSP